MTSFLHVVSYCHLSPTLQTISITVETYKTIELWFEILSSFKVFQLILLRMINLLFISWFSYCEKCHLVVIRILKVTSRQILQQRKTHTKNVSATWEKYKRSQRDFILKCSCDRNCVFKKCFVWIVAKLWQLE